MEKRMKAFVKEIAIVSMIGLVLMGCQDKEFKTALKSDEIVLKVTSSKKTVDLTFSDLVELGLVSGYGGFKTTTNRIKLPNLYTGVALLDLVKLAAAGNELVSIQVEASDGYAIIFSSDQLEKGSFNTYDPTTGEQIDVDGLKTILAFQKDGEMLEDEKEGRLRLYIISAEPEQVTDGHWSVKFVNQIKVMSLIREWSLTLEGAVNEVIDRGTFEAGTAEKCHQVRYLDNMANEWVGIPLWLIVGRVDDEVTHGDGAFNDALAQSGYQVEVIASSSQSVTFTSREIMRNNDILMVYLLNGNPLIDNDFPVRLIGADLDEEDSIGQIERIVLHFTK